MKINIKFVKTNSEISSCFEVMRELRPHITKQDFTNRIRQQEKEDYRLVCLAEDNKVLAVAGFRLGLNLAWGRFLYVDDLVTLSRYRSLGYGSKLLKWLMNYAGQQDCDQFHLDSGVWRAEAHRFYEREGLELSSYHFRKILKSPTREQ